MQKKIADERRPTIKNSKITWSTHTHTHTHTKTRHTHTHTYKSLRESRYKPQLVCTTNKKIIKIEYTKLNRKWVLVQKMNVQKWIENESEIQVIRTDVGCPRRLFSMNKHFRQSKSPSPFPFVSPLPPSQPPIVIVMLRKKHFEKEAKKEKGEAINFDFVWKFSIFRCIDENENPFEKMKICSLPWKSKSKINHQMF